MISYQFIKNPPLICKFHSFSYSILYRKLFFTEYSYNTSDFLDFIGRFFNYHYSFMCFRPIRLSNIQLPIGIMLSRLIIYHDNLADWTFSLLSHMLMSNNSLTTRRIGHYKQLIQQKVQSATTAPPHITLHLPIHRTKVFRENEVRRLYNSFSNRCEDAGT